MSDFIGPQRSYHLVTESGMAPDPAEYARVAGLVDDHSPKSLARVGAWRWPLIQKHRDTIMDRIRGQRVVDFGGAAGPLGYGSVVVDYGAEIKAIYDLPGEWGVFFSSHTLEHMIDLRLALHCMAAKLAPGGCMIHHVPSWRRALWRAENFRDHNWTFCLSGTDAPDRYTALDRVLEDEGMAVTLAVDDLGSILVIAER